MPTMQTHRHWLCAFALVILATVSIVLSTSLTAATLPVQSPVAYSELPLHDGVLKRGEGIVQTEAFLQLNLAEYALQLLDGSAYIALYGNDVTVAALTAPVRIEDSAGASVLVPIGMQWHSTVAKLPTTDSLAQWYNALELTPIPQGFMTKQLLRVPTQKPTATFATPIADATAELATTVAACSTDECRLQMLDELSTEPNILLKESAVDLVGTYVQSVQQLAALHPAYSSRVAHKVQWSQVPQHLLSAIAGCSVRLCSKALFTTIENASAAYITKQGFNTEYVSALAQLLTKYVTPQLAKQYPQRYTQLTELYTQQVGEYSTIVPVAERLEVTVPELSQSSSGSRTIVTTIGVLSEPEVLERARSILQSLGALYTVDTTVTAIGVNQAKVQNIVLPSASGERMFTFNVHVKRGEVSQLQEGNTSYPNNLWLEDFLLWLQQS